MCWFWKHKWKIIQTDEIKQPWKDIGVGITGIKMERHFVLRCSKCGIIKFKKQEIQE
jgi:hypothetical protein